MPWESREALSHQLHFSRCADSITLLDEFAFWQGRLHHPDHINQLFLHLLPNETFKRKLTTAFIHNYNFTSYSLTLSSESEKLANRIVHISVQLLANQETVLELVRENDVFGCFLRSFKLLFHETLVDGIISDNLVIDCSASLIKNTAYWSVLSDFNNIIQHKKVGVAFFDFDHAIAQFLAILRWFTGMDPQERKTGLHVSGLSSLVC